MLSTGIIYWTVFYAIESTPDLTYRWTGSFSKVEIKGVGKQSFKLRIEMLQTC
jgi:hypothetical protein